MSPSICWLSLSIQAESTCLFEGIVWVDGCSMWPSTHKKKKILSTCPEDLRTRSGSFSSAFPPVIMAVCLWPSHSGWMLTPGLDRVKSVSACAALCSTPNELIQDSVAIFTRSFCRERLPCSVLLCQAAARFQREASQGHRLQWIPQKQSWKEG